MNARDSRYRWIIIASLLASGSIQTGQVEAKLFGRFRERRGGGDGNVVSDAPVAPSNLTSMPDMRCGPEGCPEPYMPTMPQTVATIPTVTYPAAPMPTLTTRIISPPLVATGVNRSVVTASVGDPDDRVNRLINALENRLGIKASSSVDGDPVGLLNQLPTVTLQLKDRSGNLQDEAVFDLKAFVLERLNQ